MGLSRTTDVLFHENGSIVSKRLDFACPKYKARLVAKGFQHQYDVDFDKISSRVVKMTTLHFLLDVVATEDLELI